MQDSEKRRVSWRRYAQSEKGQAADARRRGTAARIATQRRYDETDKGHARNVRHEGSLKRGITRARYARAQELQEVQHALEAVR